MKDYQNISKEFQIVLYSTVGLISFITNLFIFVVFMVSKSLHTTSNVLLFNLALTDWLITVFGIPIQLSNLIDGRNNTKGSYCDLAGILTLVPFLATNFNMTLIAVHRYFMIVRNNIYHKLFTWRNILLYVTTVWFVSILLAILPLFGLGRYVYNVGRSHCMVDWSYNQGYLILLQMISYSIPITLMSFCYFKLLEHSLKSQRRVSRPATGRTTDQNKLLPKENLKLTIMLVTVVCCFFIFYCPYAVLIIYEGLLKKKPSQLFSFLAIFSAYCNSMIDFWIYAALNTKFRTALIQLKFKVKSLFTSNNVVHQACI